MKSDCVFAVRDTKTGNLVSNITNPHRKYWVSERSCDIAVSRYNQIPGRKYEKVEKVRFFLVEEREAIHFDDEFGIILVCAERYALGRRSYMPKLVIDYITPLLPALSMKTLAAFDRDLADPVWGYGDECDKRDWFKFRDAVKAEIGKRMVEKHGV